MVMSSASPISVPFFSGAASMRADMPLLEPRLRQIAAAGQFVDGDEIRQLEADLSSYIGALHTVVVGSGTDALALMLTAAGIGPGDEVVVPAYTFFATVSSVLHVGADPVMVDVLPGSYGLDPDRVAEVIGPRTRAILPVHLFCQTCDIVSLREIAVTHGLLLLEDSAEAIGMRVDGVHAGLLGLAGVLSFFPTKTLGALGDGGAVITDDQTVASRVRRLRRHGWDEGSRHYLAGGRSSRADEIQAAILRSRLWHLDDDIARRAELACRYTVSLADLEPAVRTPYLGAAKRQSNLVWYVYLIETSRRDELAEFLAANGVGTEIYYPRPLPAQPCLAGLPGARHPVPVAATASHRALALPLYPDMSDAQVDRVCALVRDFHAGERRS
jgi:UDP-2-acetamido-2-deoxy-ribo-hexuluronate aminotransferase